MPAGTQLRTGDLVQVMVGRARGKSGKILRVDRKGARVFVAKLNMVKCRIRPSRAQPQGGVLEKEAPIRWSNVMPVCGKCARPVRVRRAERDGKRVRVCARCAAPIGV